MTADLVRMNDRLAGPPSLRRTHRWLLDATMPQFPDARVLALDVEVDGAEARRWLPPGLSVPARPAARIFVAEYPRTAIGVTYRESAVLLHARLRGEPVLHCAWIVVDDDAALVLGRELLGFPKKMAKLELDEDGASVRATVERRGVRLLEIDAALERPHVPEATMLGAPVVNVWGLPGLPGVLLRMDARERVQSARGGVARLRVAGSACDPLHALGIGERAVDVRWMRVDLGVPPPGAERKLVPRGLLPVGLVSPAWLGRQLPFRTA